MAVMHVFPFQEREAARMIMCDLAHGHALGSLIMFHLEQAKSRVLWMAFMRCIITVLWPLEIRFREKGSLDTGMAEPCNKALKQGLA